MWYGFGADLEPCSRDSLNKPTDRKTLRCTLLFYIDRFLFVRQALENISITFSDTMNPNQTQTYHKRCTTVNV